MPTHLGHGSPLDALIAAAGVPTSSPDEPLLVVVNDPDRATNSAAVLRAIRELTPPRALEARGVSIGQVSDRFPAAALNARFGAGARGAVVEDAGQMIVSV